MAKTNSLTEVSGKLGPNVHVVPKKRKPYVRRAPTGTKEVSPALKKQNSLTGFINKLAGGLNTALKHCAGNFIKTDLYHDMLHLLNPDPIDNAFLLLHRLQGMEINKNYPLGRFDGAPGISVKTTAKSIKIRLRVENHRRVVILPESDCYFYEVSLLCWNKADKLSYRKSIRTHWLMYDDGWAEFEIEFIKPDDCVDYMICLRESLGYNDVEIENLNTQGMQIMLVDSLYKARQRLLADHLRAKQAEKKKRPAKKKTQENWVAPVRRGR